MARKSSIKLLFTIVGWITPLLLVIACAPPKATPEPGKLVGMISIDGSSTVYPITEAVAEEFANVQRDVRVTVGIKGTGGGFKVFCSENAAERTAIQNASRAIKPSEAELCDKAGVEYVQLLVGLDGLTMVVNPDNDFAVCLTKDELKKIWNVGSTVKSWKQVNAAFPDQPITLYGPGTDSGTFDYFTEAINGKAKQSRPDFMASEDDNTLVQGISEDENALGYFGLAYYLENQDRLKAVQIDGGAGCVAPSFETIADGAYTPLARPLYIYVNARDLERPEVREFVKFYLTHAKQLVGEVGYVNATDSVYKENLAKITVLEKK